MSDVFPITIYHNPNCGTSRNTLAAIREAGYAPTVVEYLKAGWDRATLKRFLQHMPMSDLMRVRGTPAEELGLTAPGVSEDAILDAMIAHPILVNRPIVETPLGVKLCRPVEVVRSLLP